LLGYHDFSGSGVAAASSNTGLDVEDGVDLVVGLIALVGNVGVRMEAEHFGVVH